MYLPRISRLEKNSLSKLFRIEAGSGLSDQEIERMRQDAKDHEEEDRKMREEVDKLNQAESVVYAAEKLL